MNWQKLAERWSAAVRQSSSVDGNVPGWWHPGVLALVLSCYVRYVIFFIIRPCTFAQWAWHLRPPDGVYSSRQAQAREHETSALLRGTYMLPLFKYIHFRWLNDQRTPAPSLLGILPQGCRRQSLPDVCTVRRPPSLQAAWGDTSGRAYLW